MSLLRSCAEAKRHCSVLHVHLHSSKTEALILSEVLFFLIVLNILPHFTLVLKFVTQSGMVFLWNAIKTHMTDLLSTMTMTLKFILILLQIILKSVSFLRRHMILWKLRGHIKCCFVYVLFLHSLQKCVISKSDKYKKTIYNIFKSEILL